MRKVLFVDRDGTLVESRIGLPMDSLESLRLMPGVIPALARIVAAGYELAIVTNQGGLGTPAHPRDAFERGDRYLTELFASQGIGFA
ncbi:MAG TPA: bifunctional histidinol-phosphatase/imidazoleglycerol-phosphate dehydratase, partial [Gammaproteobacteria bacterium]|nr:bifunctional histidinol-phosphatase/imidazoleglycerol-phosphate dehydratase [Gammaproteobacteria bacterium]